MKLHRPGFYLALAVCAGIAVNGMMVAYKLMPLLQEKFVYDSQYNQASRELAAIEGSPVPAKATDLEIEQLVRQVPTREELSRLLLSLKELEQKSGVVLSSIRIGDDKNKQPVDDMNAALNGQLKMSAPSLNGAGALGGGVPSVSSKGAGSAAASPQPNASSAQAASGLGFQTSSITLNGIGTYAQVVDFFNQANQLERVVAVTAWQMDSTGQKAVAEASAQPEEPLVRISMSLEIYYAGQYASIFPDMPAIPASGFESKPSPLIPDDQYWKMLSPAAAPR
ncbi:hypothetical protein [Paenibacillus solanacearum]|nr:hypothetical protein [Paenibacillus solanacearum]